jgi:tyrosyl-tRNA synthetase
MTRRPKGATNRHRAAGKASGVNVETLLSRGVAEIISAPDLKRLLTDGRPLRLKMGFDPSKPDIHLGHVVGLRKLRQFQELGHQLILIVGDWTARIGDPSGASATRPMLTAEEVRENAKTYLDQFFRVVDREQTQVLWQSQWFDSFTLEDVIRLASRFTVAQFLQRDDFRKRWDSQRPISITELLYPLLQAYDSVRVQADVEFGGTDQTFNLLLGRELQQMMGQTPQQCLMVPILVGTDGVQKMSKSLDNYVGIDEPPQEQYGKIMSLPDNLIPTYFELLTDHSDEDQGDIKNSLSKDLVNPMVLKKQLAEEIVAQFWGPDEASKAQVHFEQVFQRRELPQELPEYPWVAKHIRLSNFLVESGLATSSTQAKNLLTQGALEIDGRRETQDVIFELKPGSTIRVGRRRFLRLVKDYNTLKGRG